MESAPEVVVGTSYSITVGAGGATNGNDSIFSNITSTGGGKGAINSQNAGQGATPGSDGGSGGGGGGHSAQGTLNPGSAVSTPVVQGFGGGPLPAAGNDYSTSGGGAGGAASSGTAPGGLGLVVNILNATNAATASVGEVSGSDVYYASGGASGGLGGSANVKHIFRRWW